MGTKLIIQIPLEHQALRVYENLEIRYPRCWKIVHGYESDTYGVMTNFRKWFYHGFPFLFGGLERIDGFKFEDHQFLEYSEKENKTIEISYTEIITKSSYIDFGDYLEFDIKNETLWHHRESRLLRYVIAKNMDLGLTIINHPEKIRDNQKIGEVLKKLKRRELLYFNEDEWNKFIGLPDF